MARIRTVKPEFWSSEQVTACRPITRLFFIGLWSFCDENGRHKYAPKQLKARIFPYDDMSPGEIVGMVDELRSNGLVDMLAGDGGGVIQVVEWSDLQPISRTRIPPSVRRAVWSRDGRQCSYCGMTGGPFHLDHILPWSRGGEHSVDNLTVACVACNLSKRDRLLCEWEGAPQ